MWWKYVNIKVCLCRIKVPWLLWCRQGINIILEAIDATFFTAINNGYFFKVYAVLKNSNVVKSCFKALHHNAQQSIWFSLFFSPGSDPGIDPGGTLSTESSLSCVVGDERIDYIKEFAFKSLKLKAEKWNRFISSEDNQRRLLNFLEVADQRKLLFFTGSESTLYATDELVSVPYSLVYFSIYSIINSTNRRDTAGFGSYLRRL